jgi:Amt family ammonium transporter
LFATIWLSGFIDTPASAATAVTHRANDLVNPVNTIWVLVTAFLVFFMQAGFMALEAGFARSRETVNVLTECVVDTFLCGLLFWAFGFAFMFGEGNGVIGHQFFLLHGAPATYGSTGVAFLAFWLFQFAFADTCSTITSGAMVGRTGFKGDLLYSIGVSGFIYPIFGHWVWGPGGWLATMTPGFLNAFTHGAGFRDFAGSTVVHTVGGFVALAGAIALGPRIGRRFKRDGGGPLPPHDLTIAAIGGVILWFGWYGFNPGSTLSALDFEGIGRVAANTTLAACAGGMVAMCWVYPRTKKWDLGMSVNGFLGGLVAITCPCYWVSPADAVAIGAIAGIVVPLGIDLIEWLRVDDPVGAVAVHGIAGIWGTLSLGLFATGAFGIPTPDGVDTSTVVRGFFYGGRARSAQGTIRRQPDLCHRRHGRGTRPHGGRQAHPHAPGLEGRRARGSRSARARNARIPPGARSGDERDHRPRERRVARGLVPGPGRGYPRIGTTGRVTRVGPPPPALRVRNNADIVRKRRSTKVEACRRDGERRPGHGQERGIDGR